MRSMMVRLPNDLGDDLETVAAVDGASMVEVIRAAVAAHIETRKGDPEFRAALQRRIERDRRLLGNQETEGGVPR